MKKYLPFLLATFIMLLVPLSSVDAQAGGFVTCDGPTCSACDLVSMINRIIVWLFGFVFVVFAVLMVVAGFGLVTSGGNQSALDAAKSKFQNALIGIIIMLAAWLIVDTLMRAILAGGTGNVMGFGPWSQVQCYVQATPVAYSRPGASSPNPGSDATTPTTPTTPPAEGELTQAEAEALLANRNITVSSSGGCTDASRSNCTSLEGVRANTLNRIIELQSQVGAPLIITGGTETGHSERGQYTHGNGYKIDLATTPALNNYIYSNFTHVSGTTYRDSRGNTYYRHPPDHWDVTVRN